MLSKLLKNEKAIVLADQVIVSGATLLTQLLIVRALGLEEYGRFSAVVLVQLFLLSLQQAGVTGMYMVVYPRLTAAFRKVYLSGVLAVAGFTSLLIAVLALLVYPAFAGMFGVGDYLLILLNVVLFLQQDLFRKIFITNARFREALAIDVVNNGLQLAGLVAILFLKTSDITYVLMVCGFSFLPAIVYASVRLRIWPQRRAVKLVIKHHAAEASWMIGSALLQWVAGNFYIVAAGWWLGAATLGILRLGQYVFGLLNVLLQAIENYLLPRVSALSANPGETILYLKAAQRKMLVYIGMGLLIIAIAAIPVLRWFNVASYEEVLTVIYGMCIIYVFVIAGYPVRIALRTLKHSNIFFKGYVLSAVFGLATAWVFIHQWQLTGVLAGLFSSQVILLGYWLGVLQLKHKVIWK